MRVRTFTPVDNLKKAHEFLEGRTIVSVSSGRASFHMELDDGSAMTFDERYGWMRSEPDE